MTLPILIIAIKMIHISRHKGIRKIGSSLTKDAAVKKISAKVSILAPNSPVLLVVLATVLSIMPLKPQRRYVI